MKKHLHQEPYCAICELEEVALLLPHQGPIKDFIHQNTLMAFIHEPFDSAIKRAGQIFGARSYLDLAFFRDKFFLKAISQSHLEQSLLVYLPAELHDEKELFYDALFNFKIINNEQTLKYLAKSQDRDFLELKNRIEIIGSHKKKPHPKILKSVLINQVGINLEHEVHQLLFRLLGSYFDQGINFWPYLNRGQTFQEAIHHLLLTSKFPLKTWINNQELGLSLEKKTETEIPDLLSFLLSDQSLYTPYLQESLLEHPGWSGMVNVIAHHPESLAKKCSIDLGQLLALKLALEKQFIKAHVPLFKPIDPSLVSEASNKISPTDKTDILSLAWFLSSRNITPSIKALELLSISFLEKVWQQAMENTYYQEVAAQLTANVPATTSHARKKFQAVFCIDDRECSFRRNLEAQSSDIETLSTAGFFGIDTYLKSNDTQPQRICPANIRPKYIIEDNHEEGNRSFSFVEMASFMARHGANSTLLGFLSAYTLGHLSLFSLMGSFFHPFAWKKSGLAQNSSLPNFERTHDSVGTDGLLHGYTIQEMAERVYNTLNNMGLSRNFSPLIFILGHGSSSLNNPHFAAYDCGACSGRPGGINARIFAAMANRNSVRELLAQRNLIIPPDTVFIGGFHDTCSDHLQFFDSDGLDSAHEELFEQFSHFIEKTITKNAQERCRKFALVEKNISSHKASKEVLHRSRALFEPRPELGHATNAMVIVGRRSRSYQINFDRRAFLNSYDPHQDKDGKILTAILSAVVPVCGGINLEYYFSRVDPAIYGCGTKISHNVCSLIGVGNGLDDDLRTGLPIQMTEIHDPLRLLLVIEQELKIIENAFNNDALIKPWRDNHWLRVAALDPNKNILLLYQPASHSWQKI